MVSSTPPEVHAVEGPNGSVQYFAVSKSQNIASPVYVNGKVVPNRTATNARQRLAIRGQNKLTPKEELTINLAIRRLNNKGVVWTDHKLQNLDIVKDKSSPTGHRVVFFDFDGFRPVTGNDSSDRRRKARELQQKFDSIAVGRDAPDARGQFDMAPFGNGLADGDYVYSINANRDRDVYKGYSAQDGLSLRITTQNLFNNTALTESILIEQ